jgi:hypothetical protein
MRLTSFRAVSVLFQTAQSGLAGLRAYGPLLRDLCPRRDLRLQDRLLGTRVTATTLVRGDVHSGAHHEVPGALH